MTYLLTPHSMQGADGQDGTPGAAGPQGYPVSDNLLDTLLKMSRYYNTTMCHYWDMSVK